MLVQEVPLSPTGIGKSDHEVNVIGLIQLRDDLLNLL
jgi:hypothetical protein